MSKRRIREIYHDLTFDKERSHELFNSGVLSLRGRAMAEQIYFATINAIARAVEKNRDEYEDITADLDAALVDRYFCNFSVFQSLPDSWAIDQLFPIMPIHRLVEEPRRRGTLQDVTCDSDGKIDRFVGDKNGRPSLELHGFTDGEPYILGIFLTGAYQEIRRPHNPFGDTNAVHIRSPKGLRDHRPRARGHGDGGPEHVQFGASTCSRPSAEGRRAKNISRQEEHVHRGIRCRTGRVYVFEGEAAITTDCNWLLGLVTLMTNNQLQ